MGTGYTRNDTSNNIADGNIINAADLDGEFDAIESAMGTSGHTHDGTSAEGGPVTVLGPVQDFVASATEIKPKTTNTLDIGTNTLLFKDMFLDGVATMGSIKIDNAGTIGSATTGDAITISSGGIVTFKDDIIIKDGGTIGVTSAVDAMTVSSAGIVTFKDDIIIKDDGTIGSASDSDAIAISSGGVVSFSQNTIGKTGSGHVLSIQTSHTTMESGDVLGKIEFSAPDEASGTDAILVGASIEALAEDTFDSATNSTALVFKTNTTGAATERMRLTSAGDLHFLDNRKAIFGAGSDLQIYAASGVSFIKESGAGNLNVNAANFILNNADDSQNMFKAKAGAEVELYYNNAQKLETTATGIDVTGTVTADGLTVDGDLAVSSANSRIRLFETDTTDLNTQLQNQAGDFNIARLDDDAGGSTVQLNIDHATGNVSIPNGNLDVTGTVTADGLTGDSLLPLSITAASGRAMNFYANGGTLAAKIASTGDISFYEDTGTTAKFYWDAGAESLGIGAGDINLSGVGTASQNVVTTIQGNNQFRGILELANSTGVSSAGASAGDIAWFDNDNKIAQISGLGQDTTNHDDGELAFSTTSGGTLSEAMRIDTSGNLLLGMTSANTNNDGVGLRSDGLIHGKRAGVVATFNRKTSDGSVVEISKDNTVAGVIGTSGVDLTIGTGDVGLKFNDASNRIDPWNVSTNASVDGAFDLGKTDRRFKDLYLSGTGYVGTSLGIGTSSPNDKVDISGSTGDGYRLTDGTHTGVFRSISGGTILKTTTNHALMFGTNDTEAMRIDSSGNLIIASTGGTIVTATAGTSNFRAGVNAGNSIASGTSRNVCIGDEAGTTLNGGDDSVFVGYAAGGAISSGTQNVAIGSNALGTGITATNNTAVGRSSMAATLGSENTAVGVNTLASNQGGSHSVAIGSAALSYQNPSSGNVNFYNTAVGSQAGIAVTTGTQNTFVGGLAGDGTDDGSYNTAVGKSALSGNCGDSNTVMGYQAAVATTGSGNTCIGTEAGLALTSGSDCVLIGKNAGRTGSPGGNLTSGNNDLVLGDGNISAANIQVDWTVASDQRDKTDFTALDLGLDFVKALAPVTYKWDKRSKYGDKSAEDYDLNAQTPDGTHKEDWLDVGFKAQEVEALEKAAGYKIADKTNLTTTLSSDGKQYGMQYSKFVPILVKAIQELSAKNDALEARIATLEG